MDHIRRVNKVKPAGQIATFFKEARVQDIGFSKLGFEAVVGLVVEGEAQSNKTYQVRITAICKLVARGSPFSQARSMIICEYIVRYWSQAFWGNLQLTLAGYPSAVNVRISVAVQHPTSTSVFDGATTISESTCS